MITLIRNNVVKIVDSEEKAEKLKVKGFELLSCQSETVADNKKQEELLHCPHCDKTYKTQKGLDDHIAKEHPNAGGEDDDRDPAKDNTGGTE